MTFPNDFSQKLYIFPPKGVHNSTQTNSTTKHIKEEPSPPFHVPLSPPPLPAFASIFVHPDLDLSVRRVRFPQDIFKLEVTVADALLVGVQNGRQNLTNDGSGLWLGVCSCSKVCSTQQKYVRGTDVTTEGKIMSGGVMVGL